MQVEEWAQSTDLKPQYTNPTHIIMVLSSYPNFIAFINILYPLTYTYVCTNTYVHKYSEL